MAYDNQVIQRSARSAINEALRTYMLKIYNYMAGALALCGLIAYGISSSPEIMLAIWGSGFAWVAAFAPVVIVFMIAGRIHRMSVPAAQGSFWLYAASIGVSSSFIFAMYTDESIAKAFFITAGMFAATSAYGYTTKRDLSGLGGAFLMAIMGIIIALLVNFFFKSAAFDMMISFVTVIVFSGLVAYDTQSLRDLFYTMQSRDADHVERVAIYGALSLFIDFINIFMSLLRLFGDRR